MQVSEFLQDDAAAALCTLLDRNFSPHNQQHPHFGCLAATERHSTSSAPSTQTLQTHSLVHPTHSVLPQHHSKAASLVCQFPQAKDDECPTQGSASRFEWRSIVSGREQQSSLRPTATVQTCRQHASPAEPHEVLHRGLAHEGSLRATRNIAELMHGSNPQIQSLFDGPAVARQSAAGVPVAEGRDSTQTRVSFGGHSPVQNRQLGMPYDSSSHGPVGLLVSLFILFPKCSS